MSNEKKIANLRPINDMLIVKPMNEEQATKSGIILPESRNQERPERGTVIAVGPGKLTPAGTRVAVAVKVGDQIIFKKYAPLEITVEKENYLVVEESDILATFE